MTREQEHEKLYKELSTQVRRTNAKLQLLRGHLGEKHPGWAASELIKKLDIDVLNAVTEKGYIKYNKNLSNRQMKAILKATDSFLKAKTSTPEGVKKVVAKVKKTLKIQQEITSEQAESIYNFFESDDYKGSEVKYEQLIAGLEIEKKGGTWKDYKERMLNYIEKGNDEEMVKALKDLKQIWDVVKAEPDNLKGDLDKIEI